MLFLKDIFHDFALLPIPPGARLSYVSLACVADAFHKNSTPYISLPEFEDIAAKHLNFTAKHSRVYYEMFSVLFGMDECLYLNNNLDADSEPQFPSARIQSHCLVPPTQFILYLFNQLFNLPSRSETNVSHSGCTDRNTPRELLDGRNALAAFWKENTSKWLNLVHISNYGRKSETDLSHTDVRHLNFIFHTCLPKEFNMVLIVQSQFHNWILHNEEKPAGSGFDEDLVASCSVEFALKSTQVDSLLPSSSIGTGTIPLDFLSSWINWGMDLKPASFHDLKFTRNGVAYSSLAGSSQGSPFPILTASPNFWKKKPDLGRRTND